MMKDESPVVIFWLRRDLRWYDNRGLYHALESGLPVQPVFIFDTAILNHLEDKDDARVTFIHDTLEALNMEIEPFQAAIDVRHGNPLEVWQQLLMDYRIKEVFFNHDYEPYATKRDEEVTRLLAENNIVVSSFKDHVIFEKNDVVKDDHTPYTVFTPYKKKWIQKLTDNTSDPTSSEALAALPSEKLLHNLSARKKCCSLLSLNDIGFQRSSLTFPSSEVSTSLVRSYGENRDFPAIVGTTHLGIHFRFGTISVREKVRKAFSMSEVFVSELIWRDFYATILWHFPYVAKSSFRPVYDQIEWRNNTEEFERWCTGHTGYPLVDAGMRELSSTGYMHNRVRMVTASFLTKHLLIDWRWGESWFARKLLDFDLASNNGGWQWAAGCGTDAAPYFRIFNPSSQAEKFDPQAKYIKKWVPEFGTPAYKLPIVDHKTARERCLEVYKKAVQGR
jgi:deoxyribodipyrimidine photo-lyase